MHSATKYLGGHSDLLAGVLVTKNEGHYLELRGQRHLLGSVIGNLEAFLLLRSLRTLALRVKQQSKNATKVAKYLNDLKNSTDSPLAKVVSEVWHPSLAHHPSFELCKTQMKGFPACFAFELSNSKQAQLLPRHLKIIIEATSLGGVESLIDYRYRYDHSVSKTLLRISIGIESAKDLIADLEQALTKVKDEKEDPPMTITLSLSLDDKSDKKSKKEKKEKKEKKDKKSTK
jgi:cystathionine gamma-synthase